MLPNIELAVLAPGLDDNKTFLEAEKVVQTCCLKTHRFGGHFTLSLKNSVGLVAKKCRVGCTITCGNCMARFFSGR